jgi:hypothetical protein
MVSGSRYQLLLTLHCTVQGMFLAGMAKTSRFIWFSSRKWLYGYFHSTVLALSGFRIVGGYGFAFAAAFN